jgi:CubicO group peptidase (beta-lactamase class C family)
MLAEAIEEKSGLTAPTNAPAIPASPFVPVTQTKVDALAGFYVNSSGYATIDAGTNCLLYGGESIYRREDGWWGTTTNAQVLHGFTNVDGHVFAIVRFPYGNYIETAVTGERYFPPAVTNAWSNRIDNAWIIKSLPQESYLRTHASSAFARTWMTNGLLRFSMPSILLDDYSGGDYGMTDFVIEPYDDEYAFVQGVGGKMPCGVYAADDAMLANSYYWQDVTAIPHLAMGSVTNYEPQPDVTDWFAFDAEAGVEYFLNPGGSLTGHFMVVSSEGHYAGDGTQGSVLSWTCPSSGVYYAGVNFPDSAPTSVPVTLYNYTNTIAHMQQRITAMMAAQQVMGVSAALLDNQDVVWAEGFGYEDPEAGIVMTTNSVFHIGSVSKAFTAATVLRYLDRGAFSLDDAVTNIVPSIRWRERYGAANVITVRHLLDMYSGLPGDLLRGGFTTVPRDVGYANVTNDLAATWPVYPVDYMWSYCNAGFVLMQGVIEAVANTGATERSFADIADDELLEPLGMAATSYLFDEAEISNHLTVAYDEDGMRMPPEYINIYGTGSMYSRPTALCRFMAMIFANGGSLLQSNTVREMTSPQGTNAVFFDFWDYVPGLGWDSVSDARLDYAGRNCAKSGGTLTETAMIHLLNEHKLGVALCSSTPSSIPSEGAIEMLRYALRDKTGIMWPTNELAFPTATQTVNQAELDALAGIYVGGGGYDKVVARPGCLDLHMLVGLGGSVLSNLTMKTNGWFSSSESSSAISFTNHAGRQLMLTHQLLESNTIVNHSMRGDRYEPPSIHTAWLARTNELWYVQNEDVYSYMPLSGTTPQVQLWESDGILMMAGGLVGVKVLTATNDSLAWVYGLHNRNDSCVQVLTNGTGEMLLYGGYMFSRISPFVTDCITGSIDIAGHAGQYTVALQDANPVGSVTDVVYEATLSGAPSNFVLRIYDETGTRIEDEYTGNGTVALWGTGGTRYLYVQPLPDGVQTGEYVITFECPVLLRDLTMDNSALSMVWQGDTNATFSVESAERLDVPHPFVPCITNIPAPGPLNSLTNRPGPDDGKYYRVIEGAASNRYGRVVFLSDMHMSPFASASIVGSLLVSDVDQWDTVLASATNGYYTGDATGYKPTTPMMFNSSLTNAFAACPQPDAVLLPGDFSYYDFEGFYNTITGDPNTNNWKTLYIKMVDYILLKINQTYPDVPVYFALGNNDTFLDDYDIDIGGPFLSTSAPVFFNRGLNNIMDYTSFSATYTNGGNYTAPFGNGEIVVLETSFFSTKYPGSMEAGSNQLAYLENMLAAGETAGRPAWVLQHIPPGVDGYATWSHWSTGDTSTVVSDWKEPFVQQFNQVIADYRDTVRGIFCGHYHERGWQIANDPATSNATVPIQVMNGLLANHGNNAGFTVMTYDRDTLHPIREYSYNLSHAEYAGQTTPASWNLRFSENAGFGIHDLTAPSLLTAWSNITTAGSFGYDYFNRQYSGGREPLLLNTNNWPVYHGLIRWIEKQQFRDNVSP